MPDMRVWAVKGTMTAPTASGASRPNLVVARSTIDRPSGVSSASEESSAAWATSWICTSWTGRNSAAWREPKVMVPVLSSSRVDTSPAASTARPDIASTLRCTRRSIPAMPMADNNPPMVVGIRQTSRATSTMIGCLAPE